VTRHYFDSLSRVLAALVLEEGPSHVDRLARAPSRDLALAYVQEALRDAHSLIGLSRDAFRVGAAYDLLKGVNAEYLDADVRALASIESYRGLREALALITARALALASRASSAAAGEGGEVSSGSGGA